MVAVIVAVMLMPKRHIGTTQVRRSIPSQKSGVYFLEVTAALVLGPGKHFGDPCVRETNPSKEPEG